MAWRVESAPARSASTPIITAIRRGRSAATSNRAGAAKWAKRSWSITPRPRPSPPGSDGATFRLRLSEGAAGTRLRSADDAFFQNDIAVETSLAGGDDRKAAARPLIEGLALHTVQFESRAFV